MCQITGERLFDRMWARQIRKVASLSAQALSRLRRSASSGPEALLGVDPGHAREGTSWAPSSNSRASPESARALRPAYRPAEAPVLRTRHGNPGRRCRSKATLDSPVGLSFEAPLDWGGPGPVECGNGR